MFEDNNGPTMQDLAAQIEQQRKAASQTAQEGQQQQRQSESVPYERFKEVNDNNKALKEAIQLLQSQQQQNQQQAPAVAQQAQQSLQSNAELFTDEEYAAIEQNIVADPRSAIKTITDAVMQRGVDRKVSELEKRFDQRFQEATQQFGQVVQPMVLQNFKSQRFNASQKGIEQVFDQMVQTVSQQNPGVLSNPAALETLRTSAIAYAYENNLLAGNTQPQVPFSETPTGGGFGGLLGGGQQTQVPPQVAAIAKSLGVSDAQANDMYVMMQRNNVFR